MVITNTVPNKFPTTSTPLPYRIAIVGEAPGGDEVVAGQPFVGPSGRLLDSLLNRVGILRSGCFLGNVCQIRPSNNDITTFPWDGVEIQTGLEQLQHDIREFNPNLILLLGGTSLAAAKGLIPNWAKPPKLADPQASITSCRGSLFQGASVTVHGRKCLGTFHPASALRSYDQIPLILFDLKRARQEGTTPDLVLPHRNIVVAQTVEDVKRYVDDLITASRLTGTDIEGYVDNLTCISFATSPSDGFVIPFTGGRGANYWTLEDEIEVWVQLKRLLEHPAVPFVLQNGLYDRFVLAYTYGISITNTSDDTLVKWWELYCELEKNLSLQASICTREPYYKDERDAEDYATHWNYNGKDSCVTLECSNVQDAQLDGPAKKHYLFNMAMQNPLLYMELRGIRYNTHLVRQRAAEVRAEVYTLQHLLNGLVGRAAKIETEVDALRLIVSSMCLKKVQGTIFTFDQIVPNCKKEFLNSGAVYRTLDLCRKGFPFDDSRNGEISMLCETHLNTQSSPQMQQFLYGLPPMGLGLPVQTNKKTKKPSADVLSLLVLFKKTEKEKPELSPILKTLLRLTNLLTQLETLEAPYDTDGRIRCSFNVVGTVTGRLSSSKSPTRTGYNLQTVAKRHRDLFLADDGMWFFQCDLSGADGWTVAARCKMLGDSTMLDDYLFGLKPAKLIGLMHLGHKINNIPREELAEMSKQITDKEPSKWLYMACKRVQHGSNYLMGKITMSNQILEDSWKYAHDPIFVPPAVCDALQQLYFQRYPGVLAYHRWVTEQLRTRKQLTSANGHTRRFFGRINDGSTLTAALSDEPQNNTTYVTNTAALNLWNDRENRTADDLFIVEPLHQVHDALNGQFPVDKTEWAKAKIRSWFDITLQIGTVAVRIPFEGKYGASWHPDHLIHDI